MRQNNPLMILTVMGLFLFSCNSFQSQTLEIVKPTQTVPTLASTPTTAAPPTSIPQKIIPVVPTQTTKSIFAIKPGFALNIPRTRHTATLLSNGIILLVGGSLEPDDFVADEELLNPLNGQMNWTQPLQTLRHDHTATLLRDGRVLVVGGYNSSQQWLSEAEIYDPAADTWSVTTPLFAHGVNHSATLLQDGRVLIVGGCIGSGVCTDRVEIFDPQSDSWTEAASLDRASQTAQRLDDGRVLVVGGAASGSDIPPEGTAVLYDPQTNRWSPTTPMNAPRLFIASVKLPNGDVLAAGGVTIGGSALPTSNKVEIYNPASNTWRVAADMNQARYGFVLVALPNGQALAIGGVRDWECCWTENSFVKEMEIYDPISDQWNVVGEFPQARAYATANLLPNGSIWVAGGQYGASRTTFPSETWLIVP